MSTTLTLAGRAVPRYTSYPTAPHFSAAVGAQTYAEWLAALPDTAMPSPYLHVPYCNELCLYCGDTTKAVRRIVVTEKARPFVRLVAAAFDAYLPQNHRRHSVTV
jgi:coproporphyrinogen III oxidase-like Fe-S oxidoreductase